MKILTAHLLYLVVLSIVCKLNYSKKLNQPVCYRHDHCYGTPMCIPYSLRANKITPEVLSNETCFVKSNITFKMGTDQPILQKDGEGPAQFVQLNPFCIDQTEVSNIQFYQFVQETNYKTDVK